MNKIKQIAAMAAVIIIILLYGVTLVLSLMNNRYTERFFYASLFSSVFVPVMLYLMVWIGKVFKSYNPYNSSDSPKNNIQKSTPTPDSKPESSSDTHTKSS